MGNQNKLLLFTVFINTLFVFLYLIFSILTSRLLGPEGRGDLAIIQLWGIVFGSFFTFGIPNSIVYWSESMKNDIKSVYLNCLLFMLLLSFLVFFTAYILLPIFLQKYDDKIILYARLYLIWIPLQFIGWHITVSFYQGLRKFYLWNLCKLSVPLVLLSSVLISVLLDCIEPVFISKCILILSALQYLIFTLLLFNFFTGKFKFKPKLIFDFIKYGFPTMMTTLSQQRNISLDKIVISTYLSSVFLGYYTTALSWSNMLMPVYTSIGQIMFPSIANIMCREDRIVYIVNMLNMVFYMCIFVTILSSFVTPVIFPIIYGNEFEYSILPSIILLYANVFCSMNIVMHEIFKGLGKPKISFLVELVGTLLCLSLMIILSYDYNIIGISLSLFLCYFIIFLLLLNNLMKQFEYDKIFFTVFSPRLLIENLKCRLFVSHENM